MRCVVCYSTLCVLVTNDLGITNYAIWTSLHCEIRPVTSIRDLFHNHALEIKLGLPFSVEHVILHSVASPMSVGQRNVCAICVAIHSRGI